MDAGSHESLDWTVRSFVYGRIVEQGQPPTVQDTAAGLDIAPDQARAAYHRLDQRHALFLEPGDDTIRMAHPFSGVPTPFRVHADDRAYWANCAWDALGIPAALHADATAEAVYAEDGSPASFAIKGHRLHADGGVIHFPVPFRAWYDDLIFT